MTAYSTRVNLGGTAQAGYPDNQYCVVSWTNVEEDAHCLWNAGLKSFVAPCAGVFICDWQIWICAGAAQHSDGRNAQFVAKLVRNCTVNLSGTPHYNSSSHDVFASIGTPCDQPGVAVTDGGTSVHAAQGDTFTLILYATASALGGTCTVDGNAAHTAFSATFIPD